MALGSPATDVIMTAVELVMAAAGVVMSTLSPLASFCSMPNSSTKAPRVPEPSSREYTEMGALADAPLPPDALAESPLRPYRRPMCLRNPQAPLPAPRTEPPLQRAPPAAATAAANEKIPKMLSCRRSFQTRGSASQNHRPQGPFNSRKRPTRERRFRAFMMAPLRKRTEQRP